MADCNDLFKDFLNKIRLSSSYKGSLREARDAIENRIKTHFKNNMKEKVPIFYEQGSFALGTVVTPLDGEFDIDYGIYLQNIKMSNLPSPDVVHSWIFKSVEGHTKEKPIDKRTCVRVKYAGHYHVDLPIYSSLIENSYLAEKGDAGWHESNPVAFTKWFLEKVKNEGEQLRNVVLYLKAWADFISSNIKLPKSIVLTILAINNFFKSERDDVSFSGTIKNIYESVNVSNVISNPVNSNEFLSDRITETQWSNLNKKLLDILENANDALKTDSKEEASINWRKVFGDRFVLSKDPKNGEKPLKTKAPAILGDNGRFA